MKAQIVDLQVLKNIPSASGIEVIGQTLWIIGDDSPYLFRLGEDCLIQEKYLLFKPDSPTDDRIPKKEKPDFEAITTWVFDSQNYLLLVGSGSKTARQSAYLLHLQDFSFQKYDLANLYAEFKNFVGKAKLNIEALCASPTHLYFFQRGNISGKNAVFVIENYEFWKYLRTQKVPAFDTYYFDLPEIEGIKGGFSGACWLPEVNKIIFSVSFERTSDEINDGEILGSMLGIVGMKNFGKGKIKHLASIQNADNQWVKLKIESVALKHYDSKTIEVWAVTDTDGGESEILKIQLLLEE
jgi:hypothetical protein